tara:strand:+ start:219 stop:1067 length:849 start_codon:yes stop_codon:yes gene_type:complete
MSHNLTQPSPCDDKIDSKEILKILIESKILIISTILIFTIASIIYSLSLKPSVLTSTKLEIGYYEMPDGTQKLIEKPSDLFSDLKVVIMKSPDEKFNQQVSMTSFENKIISLETISSSAEQNENLLNEIINYIDKRHSNIEKLITGQNINKLTIEVKKTKDAISRFKSKLTGQYQSQYLNIISNLQKEDQAIENLKLLARNSAYEDEVFSLNQDLEVLIQELKTLNSNVYSKTQVIQKLKTKTFKSTKHLIIIPFGIIFGVTASIFLVLINNFIKSYREDAA